MYWILIVSDVDILQQNHKCSQAELIRPMKCGVWSNIGSISVTENCIRELHGAEEHSPDSKRALNQRWINLRIFNQNMLNRRWDRASIQRQFDLLADYVNIENVFLREAAAAAFR